MLRAMEVLAAVGPVKRARALHGLHVQTLDGLEARGLALTDREGLVRLSRHGWEVLIESPPFGFARESSR